MQYNVYMNWLRNRQNSLSQSKNWVWLFYGSILRCAIQQEKHGRLKCWPVLQYLINSSFQLWQKYLWFTPRRANHIFLKRSSRQYVKKILIIAVFPENSTLFCLISTIFSIVENPYAANSPQRVYNPYHVHVTAFHVRNLPVYSLLSNYFLCYLTSLR